ncbi:D-alanine--D-alanine ligase [Mycena amicta]|nr:D-alanine--D-alanine ligase [Mycena amicta]
MKAIHLLIIAGGPSEEHEVSIASARGLLGALSTSPHIKPGVIVVTRGGRWLNPHHSRRILENGHVDDVEGQGMLQLAALLPEYDVVFPLMHGKGGEDGSIQGLLELARVPYIGCGVLASALCMDKMMTKEVLRANGIPQVRYLSLVQEAYERDPNAILTAAKKLSSPWFVKPAACGSSVGITQVVDPDMLDAAIREALRFGRRIVIEEGVPGVRELEVAVLGNSSVEASPVGEIVHTAQFYDLKTKYTPDAAQLRIPTDAPPEICRTVQQLALRVYKLFDCAGLTRVDFFYRPTTGELFLNELNTIPGLTPGSMFFKLWEAGEVAPGLLVERLIELALERVQPLIAT